MTTEASTSDIEPTADVSGHVAPNAIAALNTKPATDKKPRPKTILELIEYSYGETGRKLTLARKDLGELSVDPKAADTEIDAVRTLAAADPFLAVPPSLLMALAELGAKPPVHRRILELVLAALASHTLFEGMLEQPAGPVGQRSLTAREVSEAAKGLTPAALGLDDPSEFRETARERLRVNAVTAFEMFRVLHDGWTLDRFVEDMASLVWDSPAQRNVPRAASLLASAKTTDALSQLSRHFEGLLHASNQQAGEARAHAVQQNRRADIAEAASASLSAELASEKERTRDLLAEVADQNQRLKAEQSSRVVDNSHLVDDYEALRTQVIRRLTAQVELLSDGLHALRNGSKGVAEEFLDRSITAINGEVTRLKEVDGAGRR